MDGEERVLNETSDVLNQCQPQALNQGGCELLGLVDGSEDDYFDASASIDPRACTTDQTALEYHWEIFFPPGLGLQSYGARGITGYHSPVLTIRASSLPSLEGTEAANDQRWRVRLTIVPQPRPGEPMTPAPRTLYFRFFYISTDLTLEQWVNCQASGPCDTTRDTELINALPPTEPL